MGGYVDDVEMTKLDNKSTLNLSDNTPEVKPEVNQKESKREKESLLSSNRHPSDAIELVELNVDNTRKSKTYLCQNPTCTSGKEVVSHTEIEGWRGWEDEQKSLCRDCLNRKKHWIEFKYDAIGVVSGA